MKFPILAVSAALTLVACGQAAQQKEEAPPAPQSLMEQVQAMAPEQQPVFAYQQLAAYQQAHPESQPTCTAIRSTESRGVMPATVATDSIYAQHVGSLVFSVQCGELRSLARYDPREHWLVVFAPGATESVIVSCADAAGLDICPRLTPQTPVPAATPAPAAATP